MTMGDPKEQPPCPRCSFPYDLGGAERYWEGRWRDEASENAKLRQGISDADAKVEYLRKQLLKAKKAMA